MMDSMHNFLPHTPADRAEMLASLGLESLEQLFADVPEALRRGVTFKQFPQWGQSEPELEATLRQLASLNTGPQKACFLGGGAYQRFIPAAVHTIASRSEFYTAYTPYQPEISQGTLQVIYEFQSMIAELAGVDVANASVYDAGNALAEAALMASRITRRWTYVVWSSVHPHSRQVLRTYAQGLSNAQVVEVAHLDALRALPQPDNVACVLVQWPNYFGQLPDLAELRAFCDASGALLVVSSDPVALSVLPSPGAQGADIVVGDIQPLGNALHFGGPYGGYMATRSAYLRQLPGRLVGKTVDKNGTHCYTLTLQTREQHIRREKATSNICTNQALNVLRAGVYLSLMGPQGLAQVATLSADKTHRLAARLCALPGVRPAMPDDDTPWLFETALRFPIPVAQVLAALSQRGILGGIALDAYYPEYADALLLTTTELTTEASLDLYVATVAALLETPGAAMGQQQGAGGAVVLAPATG
jgi:glycine dehydrogenase subunit 1